MRKINHLLTIRRDCDGGNAGVDLCGVNGFKYLGNCRDYDILGLSSKLTGDILPSVDTETGEITVPSDDERLDWLDCHTNRLFACRQTIRPQWPSHRSKQPCQDDEEGCRTYRNPA